MSIPAHLPTPLAKATIDCIWHQVLLGQSGATVYRLTRPDQTQLYLKIGLSDPNHSLVDEKDRLKWLHARLPVPHVELFVQDDALDYLLMAEIPGIDTSDKVYSSDLPAMVRNLGKGLRLFHSVPIVDCPFDETLKVKMARARQRAQTGLVPLELLAELEATRPQTEDFVLTHGDYCLPNILLKNGALSGFIDLGRAGVAGRYQDLALAGRSLAYNFGEGWVPLLFATYGIEPDPVKLAFYTWLDDAF